MATTTRHPEQPTTTPPRRSRVANLPTPDRRAEAILAGIADGFFVVDENWRFAYVNPRAEAIWKADKKRLLGKVIWEKFPHLVGSDLFQQMRRATEQQRHMRLLTRCPAGDWAEVHVYPCVGGLCVYFRLLAGPERKHARRSRSAENEQIALAREEERQRIARELHDGAGQLLTALSVGLRSLQDVTSIDEAKKQVVPLQAVTVRIFQEINHLVHGLHPAAVQELGLAAALRRLVAEFSQAANVQTQLATTGLQAVKLELGTQIGLYRIVQEALANIHKHAGATRAAVEFKQAAASLHVTIRDNGRGFRVRDLQRNRALRLGLHTMRERAEMLGGKLSLDSSSASGTTVRATIPVARS